MSGLRAMAEEYLVIRRALGFKLETWGPRLMSFIACCEERGATTVTTDLAVQSATTRPGAVTTRPTRPAAWDAGADLARHLQALDPAAEVPPGDVLDHRQCRVQPYLYSPQEVTGLMAAARTLRPAFRAVTWRTLVGLLAVTGMRQGEACRLTRNNVDLDAEAITILDSKFGKSRWVVPGAPTAAALRAYQPGPRRGVSRPGGGHVLRQQPGQAAEQAQHLICVQRARGGGRHQGPVRPAGTPAA